MADDFDLDANVLNFNNGAKPAITSIALCATNFIVCGPRPSTGTCTCSY